MKDITGDTFSQESISTSLSSGFQKILKAEIKTRKLNKIDGLTHHLDGFIGDEGRGHFFDLFDGFTKGSVFRRYRMGHGDSYFKKRGMVEKETFANLFYFWSDGRQWDKIKGIIPDTAIEFENIMQGLIDG